MERFRAAAILRSTLCSVLDQEGGDGTPKCRGGHVESRVARIAVVSDVREEEGRTLLPPRAHVGRRRSKSNWSMSPTTTNRMNSKLVDVMIRVRSRYLLRLANARRSPAATQDYQGSSGAAPCSTALSRSSRRRPRIRASPQETREPGRPPETPTPAPPKPLPSSVVELSAACRVRLPSASWSSQDSCFQPIPLRR